MKLTIVGGGGFRVPLVYGALLEMAPRLGLDELVLHDIDPLRMGRVSLVLEGLAAERGATLPFRTTTDLHDAVEGADSSSARSASASSRGASSTSRCRSASACSARRRPVRAGSASRCGRSPS